MPPQIPLPIFIGINWRLSQNFLSPGRRVPRCDRGAGEGNVAELQHTFESIKISFESFPLNRAHQWAPVSRGEGINDAIDTFETGFRGREIR